MTDAADPYDLTRFVSAQEQGGTYRQALAELRAGRKTSHWMWFVFPQIAGLGRSPTAQHFAISGHDEAAAYLAHPVLGARLREATDALLSLTASDSGTADPVAVLGSTDAQKLCSSMTLFEAVDPSDERFGAVLDRFFDGRRDTATTERL